ncbi:MAG: hypothetical protein EOP10_27305 [Proteobacteria bacterium]|nr:MAG: hypothetical protein EOP10_27305 [Pseudomonadota bacterium]
MNRFAQAFLLWLVTSPSVSFACAACGAGTNDPTRDAYTGSTAFLSVVPLLAIGGVCYTVYRYVKKNDESQDHAE